MKQGKNTDFWSRRIDDSNRLIYRVNNGILKRVYHAKDIMKIKEWEVVEDNFLFCV